MKYTITIAAAVTVFAVQASRRPQLAADEPGEIDRAIEIGALVPVEGTAAIATEVDVSRIDIDSTQTPEPTIAEWSTGVIVRGLPQECAGTIVREWLRIACTSESAALVAGSGDSVKLSAKENEVSIVLRIAPGDRRLVEIRDVTMAPSGYGGGRFGPDAYNAKFMFSESWIGERPEIALDRVL